MIKTEEEIATMRICGSRLATIAKEIREFIRPGIMTKNIDGLFERLLQKQGLKSAFKGYKGYSNHICTSLNSELVHGIPDRITLREGDILKVDMGAVLNGYYTDMAFTIGVGNITSEHKDLIQTTKEALYKGIEQATIGNRIGDIGFAVESYCKLGGYSIVKDYVGHGIGKALHEEPKVPNDGFPNTGLELREGMVIAIEPVVVMGNPAVLTLDDCWTVVTEDDSIGAHFEHTVAVTKDGPLILTEAM